MVGSRHERCSPSGPLSLRERVGVRAFLVALLACVLPAAAAAEPPSQHDILPLLELRCTACHGLQRQVSDLDLRTVDSILEGGKSGPSVIPGDPAGSPLVRRMSDGSCPPNKQLLDFGVKLPTPAEIERVRLWVAAGAPQVETVPDVPEKVADEDRAFWSFQPPRDVAPPAADVGTPVDAFILQKLRARGLTFAARADRVTLIRRA